MRRVVMTFAAMCVAASAAAQDNAQHQMTEHKAGWTLMQDGVFFGLFNHQGGPRGGDEFVAPNWWMGAWTRERGSQRFGITTMLSLDPATVGKKGYREIFQAGEALDGKPLIDRQHPHDFFMQLAASWATPIGKSTTLTLAGGPAGEPTLGPVAFVHRPSAAGLVLAPLGHHNFDSTHVSFGVVTASVERGKLTFEGSVFNGREPNEDRWNLDLDRMDSVAGRVFYRPAPSWELQVSSGRLREPEEGVPGDLVRTTASVSYSKLDEHTLQAFTAGYGVNRGHGVSLQSFFGEFTVERDTISFFGRAEAVQREKDLLLTGFAPSDHHGATPTVTVTAFTVGATRNVRRWRGFESALGAQLTVHRSSQVLRPEYGDAPVSFQAFFRLRLPSGSMGRMWNARMSQGHRMR